MEAFALAMILFSSGMKLAMVVGIGVIFGDVLQYVLRENPVGRYEYSMQGAGAVITAAALYLMAGAAGFTVDGRMLAGFAMIGVLLMKHQEDRKHEKAQDDSTFTDYNDVLICDTIVYGAYVLMALVREYLTKGALYEISFTKLGFVSGAFGKPMSALIMTGLLIALLNRVLRAEASKGSSLWLCLPVILIEPAFVWDNVPETFGTIVGIAVTALIYLTFRSKFILTNTKDNIRELPLETVTLGMIYMIFSLL